MKDLQAEGRGNEEVILRKKKSHLKPRYLVTKEITYVSNISLEPKSSLS